MSCLAEAGCIATSACRNRTWRNRAIDIANALVSVLIAATGAKHAIGSKPISQCDALPFY